jgi:hypothetical protein
MRLQGVDSYRLTAVARNLRTGEAVECSAGFGSHVGGRRGTDVEDLVVTSRGTIAWAAIFWGKGAGRAVIACTPEGEQILDSGQGIDPESLRLHGSTISWRDSRENRAAELP